ncbi:hypothetical protein MAJ_09368, partial [Metarhizium majus ARSEF 297]
MLCNAMQLQDEAKAREEHLSANEFVADMLQSDRFLYVRMQGLDDCFNIRDQVPSERVAEIANRSPPAYSIPKPTDYEPPAYTVAMESGNPDRSIQIRPRNWSMLAGFTLYDIKSIDRISLPLNCNELKFGDFYVCFEAH